MSREVLNTHTTRYTTGLYFGPDIRSGYHGNEGQPTEQKAMGTKIAFDRYGVAFIGN